MPAPDALHAAVDVLYDGSTVVGPDPEGKHGLTLDPSAFQAAAVALVTAPEESVLRIRSAGHYLQDLLEELQKP